MYNPYGDEPRLNRFLLISVVLHAVLFFTLPELGSLLETNVPGMAGGGVIQIMHVETSVNPRPSPVTNPISQTTVPRVTEPRPIPNEPPQEDAVVEPKPAEVNQPQVEQASPVIPEPIAPEPQQVKPEPVPVTPEPPVEEVLDEASTGEVLTSETGPEVVVEAQTREAVKPPVEPRPEPETLPTPQHASGSGVGSQGSNDEPGTSQSGTGTADTAPPAPPPPASGRGLHAGGGVPMYPKNAEHDGVEGVVFIVIEVSADGVLQNLALERSSGDERLDFQAMRYIEGMWTFATQPYDYSMQVAVVFSREDNRFVSNVEYGEVSWLNVP
ncbi:MAG: TonB family protein [Firmicutes bacterium]|nr:TonB family protein [Bacillota bacterium]